MDGCCGQQPNDVIKTNKNLSVVSKTEGDNILKR